MPLLCATGLFGFFDIVCQATASQKKTLPMPLLHACTHFEILPPEMLLIGDSLMMPSSARSGLPIFCVPYGYNEGRDVRELDCDAIVTSAL